MPEGKQISSNKSGRGTRGLAGLARLRQECHRFREEVACIRTLPKLQLRWPSLARLEIGNESSEDDSVWSAKEAELPNTLSIGRESEGNYEVFPEDVVELSSPNRASLSIDITAEGAAIDEQLGGLKENRKRSLDDVQSSQTTHEEVEISQGCEEIASKAVSWNARNDEDAMGSHRSSDRASEFKVVDQVLEPLTAFKESEPAGSSGEPESEQESPDGQALSSVHTYSGARIAATTRFTANPHYNSHELSTACNPSSNFVCQSEGFELPTFAGSNVYDNATHKERKVWSGQVLCSSSDSRICSSSELNGFATMDKRNRTSTRIGTDSLGVAGRAYDESSYDLPTDPDNTLLSSLHLLGPSCSSYADHEWEAVLAKLGLNGSDFCMEPVHACDFWTVQNQSGLENWNESRLAPQTSYCLNDQGMLTTSSGDPPRTAEDYLQAVNAQDENSCQNWLTEQGRQSHDVLFINDSAGGQTLPTTFRSGLAETSFLPSYSSVQNDSHSILPTENEPHSRALKKQGSGLGLMTLFGMKNFARLGVGSARDSAMTAQMAMRIKQALERLGNIGKQDIRHRKSPAFKNNGRSANGHSHRINGRQESAVNDSESNSDTDVIGPGLKRVLDFDDFICTNSENRGLKSHFFSEKWHAEQVLDRAQVSKQGQVKSRPRCSFQCAKSATPEEPDLYLQSVIAALDSTYKSDAEESTFKTSASTAGVQGNQNTPAVGGDCVLRTNLSKSCVNGRTSTRPGEVFIHTDNSVPENNFLHNTDIVRPDTLLEEKYSANDMNSTDESIPRCYHRDEDPTGVVSTEYQPAFSVEINAPPGSSFQVEVGGHLTACEEAEKANQQVLDNPLFNSSATLGRQGSFNLRGVHSEYGPIQQDSLETAALADQERPARLSPYAVDPLSNLIAIAEEREAKEAAFGTLEGSPPVAPQVDSRSTRFPRTTRLSTQEDLRHSFDRKITSLVKKANKLQEETMLSDTCPRKSQRSGFHLGHLEVTRPRTKPDSVPSAIVSETHVHGAECCEGEYPRCIFERRYAEKKDAARVNKSEVMKTPRPILKASVKPKSLDLESSSCGYHGASQDPQTEMKALGASNKRNIAWACPEAYILGPRSTTRTSGLQAAPLKKTQASRQSTTNSKFARLNDVASLAAEVVNDVRKTKERQKAPISQEPKAFKHRQPQIEASVQKNSEICFAVSASPSVETVRKHAPQRTGLKSEQPRTVHQRGGAQATNVVEASAVESFDYGQFRQELKDLQSERTKLERLVQTIFTRDADQIQQKHLPPPYLVQGSSNYRKSKKITRCNKARSIGNDNKEGKTGDVPARHLQKNPECTMKGTRRDFSLDTGDKRERKAISPNRNAGKEVVGSDSGLHVSSNVGDYCTGSNQVLKSFHLPRDVDNFDNHSLDHTSNQDDCAIRWPTQKKTIKFEDMHRKQNGVSHLTINDNSDTLHGKIRSHHTINADNGHRTIEPAASSVGDCVRLLSDDPVGTKATMKSRPQADRKTNHRAGFNVEQGKDREKSSLTSTPSKVALGSDRQGARDLSDKSQSNTKPPVASSDDDLEDHGQYVVLNGQSESQVALRPNFSFSSTDVPRAKFPNLHGILGVEDGMLAVQSGDAIPKLEVATPDYFKEYLLQALDSSILSLQQCVTRSEEVQHPVLLNEPESSNVHPSTGLASKMPERFLDDDSNIMNSDDRLSEGRTQVEDSVNLPDYFQEHVKTFDSNAHLLQQDDWHVKDGDAANIQLPEPRVYPPQSVVLLEPTVQSRKLEVKKTLLDIQKMPAGQSQECECKVSSSDKETSWSGSLKSVMEAYEEAERSATLLRSSSVEAQKLKGRPTSSNRSHHSDKLPDTEKKKLQMERILEKQDKVTPLTLLEKAERAEAKVLTLRLAHKKYMKSKQNSLRSRGSKGGKEKVQGQSRKHHSGREQWKASKLIHRTAEFGRKKRKDWNDSTEISLDRYAAGWNTGEREAAEALVTKVLNEELTGNQRRQGHKNLRPVKLLKPDIRRMKKDSVNLENYESTIAQMSEREKRLVTKGFPPRDDECVSEKAQLIQDDDNTEQPTSAFSLERRAKDRVHFFSVDRKLVETANSVLDESTIVFRKARGRKSGAGADIMNEDVRESIEHWLDTSGGFEYLDSYNSAGEEIIFEREESTNSIKRNATSSLTTGVSERNFSEETRLNNLTLPSSEMEIRRLSTSRTTTLEGIAKGLRGDLVGTSKLSNSDAIQCSSHKNEGFPLRIASYNDDDHCSGLSAYPSLGDTFCISGSDQIVREFPPQEPAQVDLIYSEAQMLYGTDRLDGSTCPSHGDHMACYFSTAVTSDLQTEELSSRRDANAGSSKFEAHASPLAESNFSDEKLTEAEELEVALLEIVLHTILRDDPSPETAATLISEIPVVPEKIQSIYCSGTPTILCTSTVSALTEGMTPVLTDDKRLHDQGVQTLVPELPSLESSSQQHGIGSAKSSGEDWPEYKCLAELESGSEILGEDEHWPEYIGIGAREDGEISDGVQIEELPVDQISTSSTSEVEIDEKSSEGTIHPQVAAVSTRPPYSAVHSMRAAERQPIDFPGIASLAFGYRSPRPCPPPSKPVGQTSVDMSSVSVQTSDVPIPQPAPLSTSIFVVPFYGFPSYTMYISSSPASAVPSVSTLPMAIPVQHGPQFISPQYAAAPTGVVPFFPPPCVFPPSAPFTQGVSQTTVLPVAPFVENSQQTQAPSSSEAYAQTIVQNSPFPPSFSLPSASEGPSQPSTAIKLAPTSTKGTSSRSRNASGDVTEHAKLLSLFFNKRRSGSSSESCRSSVATPSTILSSPEHDARVKSALAQFRRVSGGTSRFEEGSSDEAEACGGEEVCQRKQAGGVEPLDQKTLLPPCSMSVKEEEDPLLLSIIAVKQSRNDAATGLSSLPTHVATANEFILDEYVGRSDSETSRCADSTRSSVLIGSYNGSSSSEGTVKHTTRGKSRRKSSGQSSLDGVCQSQHMSPKPAGRVGISQASLRSSGEILDTNTTMFHGPDENQTRFTGRFISQTMPLSEGEVEPGQLPSEGEYFGPVPNAWGPHPRLLLRRRTHDQNDDMLEPGEIRKQAFTQLQPPRADRRGGDSSTSQSLSEGELRFETSTEPGEVRPYRLPESEGAEPKRKLAKRRQSR